MGFFDFFKKKNTEQEIDGNVYTLEILRNKIISLGFDVQLHSEYLALIVNSELEIASVIIENPNSHPSLIQIMIMTIHPKYFPNGIVENVVGMATNPNERIESAVENYINTIFNTIIESFSENHQQEMDITTNENETSILWHPNLGELIFQGEWKELPNDEPIFDVLKDKIKGKLKNQKFNWLKVYISRNSKKEIIAECLFNNEPWDEGLKIISDYAKAWKDDGEIFLAQKQFIMIRRCDKFD